ncbi:uncharacterized [Tachysurus ichikawai]
MPTSCTNTAVAAAKPWPMCFQLIEQREPGGALACTLPLRRTRLMLWHINELCGREQWYPLGSAPLAAALRPAVPAPD